MRVHKLVVLQSVLAPASEMQNIAHWAVEFNAPAFEFDTIFEGVVVIRDNDKILIPWNNIRFLHLALPEPEAEEESEPEAKPRRRRRSLKPDAH